MAQKRQTKRTRRSKHKTGGSFLRNLFGYKQNPVESSTFGNTQQGGRKRRTKKNKRRSSKK